MRPNKILLIVTGVFVLFFGVGFYLAWFGELAEELNATLKYANEIMKEMKENRDHFFADEHLQAKIEYAFLWGKIIASRLFSLVLLALSLWSVCLVCVWPWRCDECKKLLALKKTGVECIGHKAISVQVENKVRSEYSGEVVQRSEQYIPGTRRYYEATYKCKYCNAEYSVKYSEDSADI